MTGQVVEGRHRRTRDRTCRRSHRGAAAQRTNGRYLEKEKEINVRMCQAEKGKDGVSMRAIATITAAARQGRESGATRRHISTLSTVVYQGNWYDCVQRLVVEAGERG